MEKKIIAALLIASSLIWPVKTAAQSADEEQSPQILITEIQTKGTSSTDEFVELYNAGSAAVDLKGWRLSKKTTSGNEANLLTEFPEINLAPGSFALVIHENYSGSQTGSSLAASIKFSTQQSLSDNNSVILYSDAGQTIADHVSWGSAAPETGQPAPNPDSENSLQREFENGAFAGTNNVASDFVLTTPSPGQVTLPASEAPSSPPAPPSTPEDPPVSNLPSAPAPASPPPAPASATKPTASKPKIIFNELLPNPNGSDREEFIELKNIGEGVVDLSFWQIKDNDSVFLFEPETLTERNIYPGQLILLRRQATRLALNNSRDSLKLLDLAGTTIDKVSYENVDGNASYIREAPKVWRWTAKPTPGLENSFVRPPHAPVAHLELTGNIAREPVIFDASDSFDPDGDLLKFTWQITGPGQTFTKEEEIFSLILEEAGTYKINLKVSDATGRVGETKKDWRVKKNANTEPQKISVVKSAGSAGKNKLQTPKKMEAAGLIESFSHPAPIMLADLKNYIDKKVTVSGEVVEIKKGKFVLADKTGDAEVSLKIKDAEAKANGLALKSTGSITGLVKKTRGTLAINLESLEEMRLKPSAEAGKIIPDKKKNGWVLPAAYGTLALVMVGGRLVQKSLAKASKQK